MSDARDRRRPGGKAQRYAPDLAAADANAPGPDLPDSDAPDTDAPDSDAQDSDVLEPAAPDPNAPDGAGGRVWITRAAPGAQATAARVRALGWTPVVAPLLRVRPLPGPPVDLTEAGALAFTSANAVAALLARGFHRAAAAGLPVFAVGEATARAARAAGFARVLSAHGDVAALARRISEHREAHDPARHRKDRDARAQDGGAQDGEAQDGEAQDGEAERRGDRDREPRTRGRLDGLVLHLTAREPAGDLAGALARMGTPARRLALYETVAVPAPPASAARAWPRLEAVLLHSPKAARALHRLLDRLGPGAPRALCLSEAVAAPLRPRLPVEIAARPDEAALLARLGKLAPRR